MFIKLTNGQPCAYSIAQLRYDNPQVSFPESPSAALLADWGVYPYTRTAQPSYEWMTSRLVDAPFSQDVSGEWVQGYSVEQLSLDDASKNVRNHRGVLLQETDWMALSDSPPMASGWISYRQDLRDIPSQQGFPFSVTWPTKPE